MNKNELLQVFQKIEEAKAYFITDKIDTEKLAIAENILKELLNKYKNEYTETKDVKYMEFENSLKYVITINLFHFDKKVEWTDFPIATIYYYLQYIAFEKKDFESFFKYAERAFNYAPLSLSSQFEIAEAYKQSENLSMFKAETFKIYNNIFSPEDLARFYRNLGYYYTDKKYWELGFALYIVSLQYKESILAIKELDYIRKISDNPNLTLTPNQIAQLLDDFNIPKNISSKNLELLESIYNHEISTREKFPDFNKELSLRLFELTKNNKYMLYNQFYNDSLKIKFSIPFIWKKISEEDLSVSFSPDTIYAFKTDASLIKIKKGNKLGEFSFEDACNLNTFNNEKAGYKYIDHANLALNLKNGTKNFKKHIYLSTEENIYIVEFLTVINGFFVRFITTANKYDSIEKFNNQKNILEIITLLLSIEESEETLPQNKKVAKQKIEINNKFYQFELPETYPNIEQERSDLYKIGEDILIYTTPQKKETLAGCADDWMNALNQNQGFTPLKETQASKIGLYDTIKNFAQKQGYNTKAYRFILINKTLLTFVYDYKNTPADKLTKDIISSLIIKPGD